MEKKKEPEQEYIDRIQNQMIDNQKKTIMSPFMPKQNYLDNRTSIERKADNKIKSKTTDSDMAKKNILTDITSKELKKLDKKYPNKITLVNMPKKKDTFLTRPSIDFNPPKQNWTKEKTITIPVRVFNELQQAYDKGFIAGSELTGRMAGEEIQEAYDKGAEEATNVCNEKTIPWIRKETIEEVEKGLSKVVNGEGRFPKKDGKIYATKDYTLGYNQAKKDIKSKLKGRKIN